LHTVQASVTMSLMVKLSRLQAPGSRVQAVSGSRLEPDMPWRLEPGALGLLTA
jgi:hypothetical protein